MTSIQSGKNIFIIMGVSGCGKSLIGEMLARRLSIPFFDGDDYHPPANIRKMRGGTPLDDEDRLEWLKTLNGLAADHGDAGAVIACSALKQSYRRILSAGIEGRVQFIFLEGSFELISGRLTGRSNHFMPLELLKSQFEDLQPPAKGITVSIEKSPEKIVEKIIIDCFPYKP